MSNEIKVGNKVIVHYPSGDRIGHIQEVMLDGTYDIDFGGGCTGHNITRSQIEPYTASKIKVGDTVRVSEDAPRMYYGSYRYVLTCDPSIVKEIEDGNAVIVPTGPVSREFPIPTKYLVKVGAEKDAKPKFKKDDKVCINASSLKHGLRGEILTIIGVDVSDRTYWVQSGCMRSPIWLREDEISLYTEPTEQTEAEKKNDTIDLKKEAEEWANAVSNAIEEYGDAMCKTYIEAHEEAYWQAYAADLAKEIVLKVANKYTDPKQAAEYAVQTAEAVVEGLKKK